MIYKIKKIPLISLFASLLCCGCEQATFGPYGIFYNKYASYAEMEEHLITLDANIPETEQFYFDFVLEGFITSYFVAGIDDCYAEGYVESSQEHPKICDHMFNREIYYELSKDGLIGTIAFKDKFSADLDNMYWTTSPTDYEGYQYRYEENDTGQNFYYLRVENRDLLRLVFNVSNVEEDIVELFKEELTKAVLAA